MKTSGHIDCLIVGGGMAGMATAVALWDLGIKNLVLVEQRPTLGGILRWWGEVDFPDHTTGGEWITPLENSLIKRGIPLYTSTLVTDVDPETGWVHLSGPALGFRQVQCRTIVLATGAREATEKGMIYSRAYKTGVYSAREILELMTWGGLPGLRATILGSTPIGLLAMHQLLRRNVAIAGLVESLPHLQAPPSLVGKYLIQSHIPYYLSRRLLNIFGTDRVKGIRIDSSQISWDEDESHQTRLKCDTVILALGEQPHLALLEGTPLETDNVTGGPVVNFAHQTNFPRVFAVGDALHPHPFPDKTKKEAWLIARGVHHFLQEGPSFSEIELEPGEGVATTVPFKFTHVPNWNRPLWVYPARSAKGVFLEVVANQRHVLYRRYWERVSPGEALEISIDGENLAELAEVNSLEVHFLE